MELSALDIQIAEKLYYSLPFVILFCGVESLSGYTAHAG